MIHSVQLAPEIPNFHNLALFICHLFIDGNFRSGHILYDPNIFDNQLISEIDLVCPNSIPWLTTDVTEASSSLWQPSERIDHILQLIFFNPDHLQKEVDKYKYFLTFYRLFVLHSGDEVKVEKSISAVIESEADLSSSSLILDYSYKKQTFNIRDILNEVIFIDVGENLFHATFGKYEKNWMLTINFAVEFPCSKSRNVHHYLENPYYANFLFNQLNGSFFNFTTTICNKSSHQMGRHESIKIYKESSLKRVPIDKETAIRFKSSQTRVYQVKFITPSLKNDNQVSLYPYYSTELLVFFVYGSDVKRQKSPLLGWVQSVSAWMWICWIISASILCAVRRRVRLRRDGFISSGLDTFIAFFGGGTIRMQHKLERYFFGILLFGTFFLTAIWSDAFLFRSNFASGQRVETFTDLSKLNVPIFISNTVEKSDKLIVQMLRDKMDPDVHYAGIKPFLELLDRHDSAFAYVLKKSNLDYMKYLVDGFRDFDSLPESLGSLDVQDVLTSNHYVPARMVTKVNEATSKMMQNGLWAFYENIGNALLKIYGKGFTRYYDEEAQALTMEQMMVPFIILTIFLTTSLFAFIGELIIYHSNNRRRTRIGIQANSNILV